uniref:Transmembrane protein 177 n=1 Tax=Sphenodon punctatus TaxID=8508 RepID=A0A8D0LBN5_SPHPU
MTVRSLWQAVAFVERHRASCLAVSCVGLLGASLSYHLFPKQTFQLLYQSWPEGQPARLSEALQDLFRDVLDDVGVKSPNCYRAFAAYGFQTVSAGVPWLPGGSVVGIPDNFNFTPQDSQGIVNYIVVLNSKEVNWESKDGLALKEALTLSREARKFAIAREVVYLQSNSPIIYATVAPVCLASTYISGVTIKQLLGLYSGPMVLRGFYNLVVAAIGYVGYCLAYDAVNRGLDYRSDRKTAMMSKDYARGGVEFYDKILSHNRTLRFLLGKQGEATFALNGNLFPRHWLRSKHTPYTSRRDRIVNVLRVSET